MKTAKTHISSERLTSDNRRSTAAERLYVATTIPLEPDVRVEFRYQRRFEQEPSRLELSVGALSVDTAWMFKERSSFLNDWVSEAFGYGPARRELAVTDPHDDDMYRLGPGADQTRLGPGAPMRRLLLAPSLLEVDLYGSHHPVPEVVAQRYGLISVERLPIDAVPVLKVVMPEQHVEALGDVVLDVFRDERQELPAVAAVRQIGA